MSFKFFGKMYRVRKGSPMHYFIEIGAPIFIMLLSIIAVYVWGAVL